MFPKISFAPCSCAWCSQTEITVTPVWERFASDVSVLFDSWRMEDENRDI